MTKRYYCVFVIGWWWRPLDLCPWPGSHLLLWWSHHKEEHFPHCDAKCFLTSQTRHQVSSGHLGNIRVRWRHGTEKYNQYNYDKKSTTSDAARQCLCCGERPKLSMGKFGTKIPLNKLRNPFLKSISLKTKSSKIQVMSALFFSILHQNHPPIRCNWNKSSFTRTHIFWFLFFFLFWNRISQCYCCLHAVGCIFRLLQHRAVCTFPPFLLHLYSHVAPLVYQLFSTLFA